MMYMAKNVKTKERRDGRVEGDFPRIALSESGLGVPNRQVTFPLFKIPDIIT